MRLTRRAFIESLAGLAVAASTDLSKLLAGPLDNVIEVPNEMSLGPGSRRFVSFDRTIHGPCRIYTINSGVPVLDKDSDDAGYRIALVRNKTESSIIQWVQDARAHYCWIAPWRGMDAMLYVPQGDKVHYKVLMHNTTQPLTITTVYERPDENGAYTPIPPADTIETFGNYGDEDEDCYEDDVDYYEDHDK